MIRFAEWLIRKRNPSFSFDNAIDSKMLIVFLTETAWKLVRGFKLVFLLRNPKGAMLGKNTRFSHLHKISFGSWLKTGDYVKLSGLSKSGLSIGNNVGIGSFSQVIVSMSLNDLGQHIRIGNNVGIGEFAYLGGAGGLTIGDDCIIGQYFSCHPENHNYNSLVIPVRLQGITRKGIEIGRNCWIGSKVTILDGVKIGNDCVIAAGSVITKSFPDRVVIGGVPARIIKTINSEESFNHII